MLQAAEPLEVAQLWSTDSPACLDRCVLARRFSICRRAGKEFVATDITGIYGVVHRLMVRLRTPDSSYWSYGWAGTCAEGRVRARMSLDGAKYLVVRASTAQFGAADAAGWMRSLREDLLDLLKDWPGVRAVEQAKCACAESCTCWLDVCEGRVSRGMSSSDHRAMCDCGVSVEIARLGFGSAGAAAAAAAVASAPAAAAAHASSSDELALVCSSPLMLSADLAPELGPGWAAKDVPLGPVDYAPDITGVRQALKKSDMCLRVTVSFATPQAFAGIVSSHPKVLHFSGHGIDELLAKAGHPAAAVAALAAAHPAYLLFESNASVLLADAQSIHEYFERFPVDSLVFLSACESRRVGEAILHAGPRHVVATTRKVYGDVATFFSDSFYEALFRGASIAVAFGRASAAARCSGLRDAAGKLIRSAADAGFVLLPEGDPAQHEVVLFPALPRGFVDFPDVGHDTSIPPAPAHAVCGREVEAACVVSRLSAHRTVLIHGARRTGKSVVAAIAARHISVRRMFDAVVWVDVSSAYDEASCVYAVNVGLRGALASAECHIDPSCTCEQLSRVLQGRRVMLVLDNCDSVDDASLVRVLNAAVGASTGVRVLITRVRLAAGVVNKYATVEVGEMQDDLLVGRVFDAVAPRHMADDLPALLAPFPTGIADDAAGSLEALGNTNTTTEFTCDSDQTRNKLLAHLGEVVGKYISSNVVGDIVDWALQLSGGTTLEDVFLDPAVQARATAAVKALGAARQKEVVDARVKLMTDVDALVACLARGGGGGGGVHA